MNVLLVGPDHEENLSIRYLSSALQGGGHDTVLASFNSPVDASAVTHAARAADLVGLSLCFQARAGEFLALARRLKAQDPNQIIVAGGHYASCAAEPLLLNHPEVDLVVIHEGERTLVEIAAALPDLRDRLPNIPGLAYRDDGGVRFTVARPALADLDSLPFPDRRGPVHWIAGVPTSYLMGSRGCYGDCAYCCITTLHRLATGKRFRQRGVEAIAAEMATLYRERGTRQFIFHDDNFLVPSEASNHQRISALENALKSRGVQNIALVIKCRPADATGEVLRRLKALGLVRVFLGVESATARGLSVLERDQSVTDSVAALELCGELGISAQFTLMTFHPDTTLDTLRADVAFLRRFSGNPLNFCRTEIYAGTPLEKRMIEFGRATGDYRARSYRMADPVADLACAASLKLFHFRCWSNGSLMQSAIGLDHAAAVVKRFHRGSQADALARSVQEWVRRVNVDTVELLDQVVELSAATQGIADVAFARATRALTEREALTRCELASEARSFTLDLQALRLPIQASQRNHPLPGWSRLATPAAAALLAIGIPATAIEQSALAQQSQAVPSVSAPGPQKGICVLGGRVVDQTGATVSGARITITNADTKAERTTTTGATGEYQVSDLPVGQYTVKAESPGFKVAIRTGIVLKEGVAERIDVGLTLEVGSCEYVAVELNVPHRVPAYGTKKAFTYVVGQSNNEDTFRGIAKVVYHDPNRWLQIFEANRNVMEKPGIIPYGTALLIPPKKRAVPKLIHKVTPVYPQAARTLDVSGDVLLNVMLKPDGAVEHVSLIEGKPLLSEVAMDAVRQWRYRPLRANGEQVSDFVVLVSFGKDGRVGVE